MHNAMAKSAASITATKFLFWRKKGQQPVSIAVLSLSKKVTDIPALRAGGRSEGKLKRENLHINRSQSA
jgi:hypothetical protein